MEAADGISWFQYNLSREDFVTAQQLHQSPTWKKLLRMTVAWPAIVCAIVWLNNRDLMQAGLVFLFALPIGFIFIYAAIYLARLILVPLQARRIYNNYPLAHETAWVALSAGALHAKSSRGEARYAWSNIIKWRENKSAVLAYFAPNLFLIIPQRVADLGFPMDELKGALAREVGLPNR